MRNVAWVSVAALTSVFVLTAATTPPRVDLIIRGGTIYTGRAPGFVGDVAVRGDKIFAVGRNLRLTTARVIDAKNMVVAPGFIDPHTHIQDELESDDQAQRLVPAFLLQGVTTAFIGNDGFGGVDVAETLDRATTKPVGINYAAYVGFGPIRERVVGASSRAPTVEERSRMKALVRQAMCDGALGLSTGLFYAPQSFASTDDVVELARVAASAGGLYDSHIRDESSYTVGLEAAVDEALRIGWQAGISVHIAHIKALGVDKHGHAPAIIAKIEAAQGAGQKVTADQYPWSASGSSLAAALIPSWAQDGGRDALLRRLDDTLLAKRLHAEIAENIRKRGGADTLLITGGAFKGRTLAELARARNEDPVAAGIAALKVANAGVVSFNQIESDIAAFMQQPWVMTGSDASKGHPRFYGTFARKYDKYVIKDRRLTLRQFVERSSTLAADTFQLAGRGRLRPGAFADVVVLDPKEYAERATYEQPTLTATGVRAVLVNGTLAVDGGRLTGKAAGRAIRRRPTTSSCG